MIPGEVIVGTASVEINKGLDSKRITVLNKGDRPIQVGSHFHFFEANRFLSFDREAAFGFRLDIPSGTAVRFEPNEEKEVELVAIAGNRRVLGFNNLTDGQVNTAALKAATDKAQKKGFI